MAESLATVSTHGRSQHVIPPSGRSYWVPVDERVVACGTCHGEGHHDSCFDCGNRGYHWVEASDDDHIRLRDCGRFHSGACALDADGRCTRWARDSGGSSSEGRR